METCDLFCQLFTTINWIWYFIAVLTVFAAGAAWHTFLFAKMWAHVFKVDIPEKVEKSDMLLTMSMQLLATALMGLVFFILTHLSVWVALFALIGFCGWQKATLKFRYTNWALFVRAAWVEAGYTCVTGLIFILFALL